jgi:cellulose synthase/poly-beta-1,6-N-acetylglucosamine synthase-like glycosyltransferase/exo-beta-1,3-glucanase (GH17 family)
MRFVALAGVVAVACMHAGAWTLSRDVIGAPGFRGQLASVSYAPFNGCASSEDPRDSDKNKAEKTGAAGNKSSFVVDLFPPPKDETPKSDPTACQPEQIRADLQAIAPYTRVVRTYSATRGMELVPEIAQEFGLRVAIGATLDPANPARNEREIQSVIALAKKHRNNIDSIVVGNETIYTNVTIPLANLALGDDAKEFLDEEAKRIEKARTEEDKTWAKDENNVQRLIKLIQRVRRETSLPVTTGEIQSHWRFHPSLASAVDFVAAHILPYWEKVPENQAVDYAIRVYGELGQAYPGKRIVIAEFGWPSAGPNRHDAQPGPLTQATVLRNFVNRAEQLGVDYNIIEAYDQPWKARTEGGVGPYWGFFDASRQPKFSWTGPIHNPDHWKLTAIAAAIGVLLSLPILALAGATFGQAALLATAAHIAGAWLAILFAYWNGHYFVPGAAFAFGLALALLVPMIFVALTRIEEIAAIAFGRKPVRLVSVPPLVPELPDPPKVSIHIPAYREPPAMLKVTLDAVARLNYPNFECVLVINNTPDPAMWQSVEEHCKTLGERFKFVREDKLEGFKAGALRLALTHTAEDAEIIGVLDADYVVQPDWLKDLVPLFADAKVGLIQAPQDHRDAGRSVMHTAMNGEYTGFFDIGMVQRNEHNAIVTHGTMCLIRRSALVAAGNWSSDTICEDTDLGLTILELGWTAHYTNRRYGHGLLPDSYQGYKRQRDRWAYGGFQILKKHWRRFLPGRSSLSREQKREFLLGWMSWLGAESIGVLMAALNLFWILLVPPLWLAYDFYKDRPLKGFWTEIHAKFIAVVPDQVLTIPIITTFAVAVIHFVSLYRLRVAIKPSQMLGSVIAAMAMQWSVARAVGTGIVKDGLPFVVTAKGGARRRTEFPAFWEAVLGTLLLGIAGLLYATNFDRVYQSNLFAAALAVQALPFIASVAMALLERSRVNDFTFWRGLENRIAELRLRRPVVASQPTPAPAPIPAEERVVETAQ